MNPYELRQIGRYRVNRFIAEGGMAWVFEVVDTSYGDEFEVVRALKLLKPQYASGDDFERFRREAAAQARLDHPNLVTVYEADRVEIEGLTYFYYTMTYIDGPSLAQLLATQGALPPPRAIEIICDVLSGLAVLHRNGIIHRDIKPGNIFTHADGRVRLGDLGIARVEGTSSQTKTGTFMGTFIYASPEQALARGELRATSDVFSIGLTLFEALVSKSVYDHVEGIDSTSGIEILSYLVGRGRMGGEIEIDFADAPIPAKLAAVVQKALRIDPNERYQDAAEMLAALNDARVDPGKTVVFRHADLAPPARGLPSWLWGLVAMLALVAAGFGGWRWWDSRQTQIAVREQIALAEQLNDRIPAIEARAQALDEPLPRELRDDLVEAAEAAEEDLDDARRFADSRNWEAAGDKAEDALKALAAGCERVNAEFLGERVDARVRSVGRGVESLRGQGAAGVLPTAWAALIAQVDSIPTAPTSSGCIATEEQLARYASLHAASEAAESLTEKLQDPNLLAEAVSRAEQAWESAKTAITDAAVYLVLMERAEEAMAQVEIHRGRGQLGAALEALRRATNDFRDAALVRSANQAQQEADQLASRLRKPPPPDLARVLTAARTDYDAGRFADATESYWTAIPRLREVLAGGREEAETIASRENAMNARRRAIESGSDGSAMAQLADAQKLYEDGEAALGEERWKDARGLFESATKGYEEARRSSDILLASAQDAQRKLREQLRFCDTEGLSDEAVQHCRAAWKDFASAGEVLAGRNAVSAVARLDTARAELDKARKAEGERLYPPEIVARTPNSTEVRTRRGRRIHLGIEASDRNPGERLVYAWDLDGTSLPGTGSEMEFRPEQEGMVTATVTDPTGLAVKASWQIRFENSPPRLSLTPGAERFTLELGGKLDLTATATDPDGDPVEIFFDLDGKKTAGPAFRFTAERPGEHRLEVIARDSHGATRSLARTLVVRRPPTPVAKPVPTRKPPPKPIAKNVPLTSPPPDIVGAAVGPCENPNDPNRPLAEVLQLFATAFETCKLSELERVWRMNPTDKLGYQQFCSFYRNLDISGIASEFDNQGKQASICFQWNVTAVRVHGGQQVKFGKLRKAELTCRSDGWYFTKIKDGCGS